MSVPLNHHYVSQCHIQKFFNSEGILYLYDKSLNNFYKKRSSKGIFSERFSNSIYRNGIIDHSFLEEDLKIFEDEFPSAVAEIENAINTQVFSKKCQDALSLIALFGIFGEVRSPFRKQSLENSMDKMFDRLKDSLEDDQLKSFERTKEYKKHVVHSNTLIYSEVAFRTYELMGVFDYHVWHLESNDCFLLPDTTATQVRGNLGDIPNQHVKQIMQVGIPVSDKIFVQVISKKLKMGSYLLSIKKDNDPSIEQINLHILEYAYKTVATSNMDYLRKIVSKAIK